MKKRKRKFWQPVVTEFVVLYLIMMILATMLMAQKFAGEFREELEQYAISVLQDASGRELDVRDGIWQEEDWNRETRGAFYQELSNQKLWMIDNDFMSASAAFYDENKNLLAQSRNEISGRAQISDDTGDFRHAKVSFGLNDYLSSEELAKLAAYRAEDIQTVIAADFTVPSPYKYYLRLSADGKELLGIIVQEVT